LRVSDNEGLVGKLRHVPVSPETVGRPLGDAAFLGRLERESGRTLAPGKRERKPLKSAVSP
jgi:hypothetical protein